MRGIDALERAAESARNQVKASRDALAASRAERSGGPARNARDAEQQLNALRGAVADDVRALRDRLTGKDPAAARRLRIAALTTSGAIAGIVGASVLGRRSATLAAERRQAQRQAIGLARALAEHVLPGSLPDLARAASSTAGRSRPTGRRGGAAVTLALLGTAVAGAVLLQRRRDATVDPDDLWLPEEPIGPA